MKIQKLTKRNLKKLPAQTVVIELLDKSDNHLAYIACRHEQRFHYYDYDNDYHCSQFLEEVSNFESEVLQNYFQITGEPEKYFNTRTGEMIITGKNSEIILHERPA